MNKCQTCNSINPDIKYKIIKFNGFGVVEGECNDKWHERKIISPKEAYDKSLKILRDTEQARIKEDIIIDDYGHPVICNICHKQMCGCNNPVEICKCFQLIKFEKIKPMIKLKKLHPDAILPTIGSEDAACYDLYALEDVEFKPGEIKLVKTGWAIDPPLGWRTNIYVRSSTSLKKDFMLANSVGIIDADYRGELCVQLMNIKLETIKICIPLWYQNEFEILTNFITKDITVFGTNIIKRGDKIAQFELVPHNPARGFPIEEVDQLSETQRGEGGFGSSGK